MWRATVPMKSTRRVQSRGNFSVARGGGGGSWVPWPEYNRAFYGILILRSSSKITTIVVH